MLGKVHTRAERVAAVDACLPQTQCARCGYAACRPYAEAIVDGRADINRCPPGGGDAIAALAGLLGVAEKALDPECGPERELTVAVVDEQWCIGCTLCIQACPVDAIIGAAKQMHVVICDDCTGCELCVAPCPVDCIEMVPVPPEQHFVDSRPSEPVYTRGSARSWTKAQAERARRHYARRQDRLERLSRQGRRHPRSERRLEQRRASVAQAVERVHRRRRGAKHDRL